MKQKQILTTYLFAIVVAQFAEALPSPITEPITNPSNRHTYYLLQSSSWTDAEAAAVALGGHLVTINDQAENDWVWNTFFPGHGDPDPHLWIGLNNADSEGTFEWVSGEPATFLNWDSGQPDNAGGVEDYVGMWQVPPPDASGIAGKWNDFANFIPTGTRVGHGIVEVPFLKGWLFNPQNNHLYRLSAPGTWEQVQAEAEAAGGYLVAIGSAEENQWIVDNFLLIDTGTEQLWIGFNDLDNEGTWVWSNGEPVTYINWDSGEPNNENNEDYGAINNSLNLRPIGTWNDMSTFNQPGIIEIPGPIKWSTCDGGNNHYYMLVPSDAIEWIDAKSQAETMIFKGVNGHLATITTAAEDDFITNNVLSTAPPPLSPLWIGGIQAPDSPEPDGGWSWVTGELWSFTNWDIGEPSNSQGGTENALEILWEDSARNGTWNDNRSTISVRGGYIVEFDTQDFQTYHADTIGGNDGNDGLSREGAFKTIQAAIEAACDGDTVLVWPGVYNEEINFLNKAITVRSAADAAVIRAAGSFAVNFVSGEGLGSVLRNVVVADSDTGIHAVASAPTIEHVTVVNNNQGIWAESGANPTISHALLWNNANADLINATASYSWVEDELTDPNAGDPLFAEPNNGDYHLQSERGRYRPAQTDPNVPAFWVLDEVTSPAIDAGNPAINPAAERMPNGGRVNIGAYGDTAYASLSEWPLWGDNNRDGFVNLLDFAGFVDQWLNTLPWAD